MDPTVQAFIFILVGMLVGALCAFAGVWMGSRKR